VLEEENDGGDGNERADARDEIAVDKGRAHMLKARGNGLEDGDGVVGDRVTTDVGPAGDRDDNDDEGRAKGIGEEGDAADEGAASAKLDALEDGANDEEEDERGETECGVPLRVGQVFERVDLQEMRISVCFRKSARLSDSQ
jgi:hypothetical protein